MIIGGSDMNICVFGAASSTIDTSFIDETTQLGEKIALKGHTLIYGAGASGLMGAVARGVYAKGGNIIGVVPDFFVDEDMGVDGRLFDKCTELILTDTMRERKRIMEDKADAFIVTPGGIGTFEEFFEVFTLKQLQRHSKAIAILNLNGYYDAMLSLLQEAEKLHFVGEACRDLIRVFTDIDEMLDYIENYEPENIKVFEAKNI